MNVLNIFELPSLTRGDSSVITHRYTQSILVYAYSQCVQRLAFNSQTKRKKRQNSSNILLYEFNLSINSSCYSYHILVYVIPEYKWKILTLLS